MNELWKILRSQVWVVAITLVLGLAFGVVYAFLKPHEYRTSFVLSIGIVGDTWVRNPILIEERCQSYWFLDRVSEKLNRRYSVYDLDDMVDAEVVTTPTKGLTREVRVAVKNRNPQDCYDLANTVAALLIEEDQENFDKTYYIYNSYLQDLARVMDGVTASTGRPGTTEALAPTITVKPEDDLTEYSGGAQVYSLFGRQTPYVENPYLLSSLALLEQVYIDTYVKTRSPIFSQPTTVVVPPRKPTEPEGPSKLVIIVAALIVSAIFGFTLAAINYRLQQARARV